MSHLPTSQDCQRLFKELKQLDERTGFEFNARKYELIHDLAEGHWYEARFYLLTGMDSPDPDYRWACISALVTHWQGREPRIISRLMEMALHDPDEQVRQIAIDSLGIVKTREALPMLRQIIENSHEPADLMKAAYLSIMRILDYPLAEVDALWSNLDASSVSKDLLNKISNLPERTE